MRVHQRPVMMVSKTAMNPQLIVAEPAELAKPVHPVHVVMNVSVSFALQDNAQYPPVMMAFKMAMKPI